jgi:hypothetical protein
MLCRLVLLETWKELPDDVRDTLLPPDPHGRAALDGFAPMLRPGAGCRRAGEGFVSFVSTRSRACENLTSSTPRRTVRSSAGVAAPVKMLRPGRRWTSCRAICRLDSCRIVAGFDRPGFAACPMGHQRPVKLE